MRKHKLRSALLVAGLVAAPAIGQNAAGHNPDVIGRLIDRIVAGEQQFLARMKPFTPLLETYIQETPENGGADAPPSNDHYMLGRLDFSEGVEYTVLAASPAFRKRSGLLFRKSAPVSFSPVGFAQMVIPDADEFDRETYHFEYLRREFLGDLRCLVLDVSPKSKKAAGKFVGRIWVEDKEFRIVRFNGTYSGSRTSAMFFHFDSWRMQVAPGLWAPVAVYVEDADTRRRKVRLKAQTRLWGYNSGRSGKQEELTTLLVEADHPVRDENGPKDVSPLESERWWKRQAEENVIDRLEKSGLLAPRSEVDRVLNTVVTNLIVSNDLSLEAQCRVLLTTPLETFSIGRTIVISRGLLDVLPDEASLAMVLSDELAHIALNHPTETMYAFSDRTMFAEDEILSRLRFTRTPSEIEAAGKKALHILSNSPYKDKLSNAGLFLKALESRAPRLPNLIQANLGNQMASAGKLLRLSELAVQAPPLDESKLEQIAALPLGSRVKLDPWTNQIALMKAKPVALLSAREKMPFEVTPVVIHLTRLRDQ